MSLEDAKRRILTRVPLDALIGESVKLIPRSGRLVGCCPFHNEKTPSFYIFDDHYYCFGCKVSGDAIDYVRHTQGMGFIESLRYLAGKYGVEVPELDEDRGRQGQFRQDASLYRMLAEAQEFFQGLLASPAGAEVRTYLLGRGFSEASIVDCGFGMTPPESFGLVRHLRQKGHREEDMIAASLATASTQGGRAYDFFRQRLTIPIRDPQGRIIAFGGRTLADDPAKYKNSRESRLFDKSHVLFGLDRARKTMRQRGRAIVVEGYMDALVLREAGFPETVACLGTAFTEAHLRLLKQSTGMVILLLDGDSAGQRATVESVDVALTAPEVMVRAVSLPDGFDPDDFVRQRGRDELESLLAAGRPLLDFAIERKLRSVDGPAVPAMVNRELLPWLARLSDPMQRDFIATRIAQMTGIDRANILGRLGPPARPGQDRQPAGAAAGQTSRSGAAASETPVVPVAPLPNSAYDLLGHLFHAAPGEIPVEEVRTFLGQSRDLPPYAVRLAESMLDDLAAGRAPATAAAVDWGQNADPAVLELIGRLKGRAAAFASENRQVQVLALLAHTHQRRLKDVVARLKGEVARLAATPGTEAEVIRILQTIKELNSDMQKSAQS